MICSLVGLLLTLIFHKNKPPSPPSMSQKLKLLDDNGDTNVNLQSPQNNGYQHMDKTEQIAIGVESSKHLKNGYVNVATEKKDMHMIQLKTDLLQLLFNIQFVILVLIFAVFIGFINGLATVINQYTAAFGYNSNNAGLFGLCITIGGTLGTFIGGMIMEKTKQFNIILKCTIVLSYSTVGILVCSELKQDNGMILYILFAAYGFFTWPLISVAIEAAAETTYPISEDIGIGVIMVVTSAFTTAIVMVWDIFLPTKNESYHNNTFNYSTLYVMSIQTVGLILGFMYNGKYKRLNVDSGKIIVPN